MFDYLYNIREGMVYSFGRIKDVKENKICIGYKKKEIWLYNIKNNYFPGDWIRFYGYFDNKKINVKFIEDLKGIDIAKIEDAIEKIKKNSNIDINGITLT